jgi:hypothetical protein
LITQLWQVWLASNELEFFLWRYWWMKMLMKGLLEASASPAANLWNFVYYGILAAQQYPEAGNIVDEMILSAPLEALFGAPLYYNIKALGLLTANALCGYALILWLTRSRIVAFLMGALFTFNTFVLHLFLIGRMREGFIGLMALYVLYLLKTFQEDRAYARLAGLCLGLASIVYWFYGFFLLFFTGLYLVYRWINERRCIRAEATAGRAPAWKTWAVILFWFLLIAYPFAHPYAALIIKKEPVGKDLAMWPRIPPLHQVLNPPPAGETSPAYSNEAFRLILRESLILSWPFTATVTVLMIFALFTAHRIRWLFLCTFAIGFLLALGPYLRMARDAYLPYALWPYHILFKWLPLFSRFQRPDRFLSLAILAAAVLGGLGLAWLIFRAPLSRASRMSLAGLVLIFHVLELSSAGHLPVPSYPLPIPQIYREIAKDPERIGILEVPLGAYFDNINFYQSIHRKRIFEPWIRGVYPQDVPVSSEILWLASREDLWYNTYLQHLKSLSVPGGGEEPYAKEHLDDLADRKFKYVILHQANCLAMRNGLEVYRKLRADLDRALGPPVAVDHENVLFASLPLSREASFEIRVYRLKTQAGSIQ